MPIPFTIHPSRRLVRYTVEGVPTADEVSDFFVAVLSHHDFKRGFAFLGDARGPDCVPHSAYSNDIAREVKAWIESLAPCKWAVIVTSPAGIWLVRRQAAQTPADDVDVVPFRTEAEAVGWLAVAPGQPDP